MFDEITYDPFHAIPRSCAPMLESRITTVVRPLSLSAYPLRLQFRCAPGWSCRYASSKHPSGFIPPTQGDLEELRDRTIEFARREIPNEVAQAVDHSNAFPIDMWKKLGEAGFLGITADESYGGLAMGYQAHCIVMEELSRASGVYAVLQVVACPR